jgi:beta-lactam-binding protein with PASTA domain
MAPVAGVGVKITGGVQVTVTAPPPTPLPAELKDLDAMSVKELKQELGQRGIKYQDMVEKNEMREAVKRARLGA